MGLSRSKYSYCEEEWRIINAKMYANRAHTNILIVGDKSSGKTTLTKRLANVTKINKLWIHIIDSATTTKETALNKIKEVYDNGVDTTCLSIVSTSLPLHGVIWVVDATKINTLQDFVNVSDICCNLRSFNGCIAYLFFSRMDLASRTNLNYIQALYTENKDVPNSGIFSTDRIFYAPLTDENNKDADFTIIQMANPILEMARCNSGRNYYPSKSRER